MKNSLFLLALGLLATVACRPFYTIKNFDERTAGHKIIAVLPFENTMTGRLPKDMTDSLKSRLEIAESEAFQQSLVNQILLRGNRSGRHLRVAVQEPTKTRKLLKDNGLGIRESWEKDPQELAKMLGVDAVVRCKVRKQRFLSGLESVGIEVGAQILTTILFGTSSGAFAPTNEVEMWLSVVDAADGAVLFSFNQESQVNWQNQAQDVIDQINRRAARRFPYSN